jgi:UPF0716 protein FxsA
VLALVLLFVVVPLVELYVLAQVSHAIGLLPALIVLLLVSIAGAAVVKRQGLGVLRNVRRSLNDRQLPTEHIAEGALVLLSGAMLVVPGFVTDALGAVLLVPPVRRRLARYARDRYARRGRLTATYSGRVVEGVVVTSVDTHTGDVPGDVEGRSE